MRTRGHLYCSNHTLLMDTCDGESYVKVAAKYGFIELVEKLLNESTEEDMELMFIATCEHGHTDIVRMIMRERHSEVSDDTLIEGFYGCS